MKTRYLKIILMLIFLIGFNYSFGQENFSEKDTLRIGIPINYLDSSIKPRDAKAAFTMWTNYYSQSLKEKIGLELEMKFYLYENINDLKRDVIDEFLDLVSIATYEYLTFDGLENYEIKLSGLKGTGKNSNYLVICNIDSEFRQMKDLDEMNFYSNVRDKNNLMNLWLKKILFEEGVKDSRKFMDNMKLELEQNQIIYSVFFDKKVAGLVRKDVLELVSTLNPQIKNKIKILHQSKDYVENVTVLKKALSDRLKRIIIENSTRFHETVKEEQLLSFFKVNRLVELEESDLKNSKELLEEIYEIQKLQK